MNHDERLRAVMDFRPGFEVCCLGTRLSRKLTSSMIIAVWLLAFTLGYERFSHGYLTFR